MRIDEELQSRKALSPIWDSSSISRKRQALASHMVASYCKRNSAIVVACKIHIVFTPGCIWKVVNFHLLKRKLIN